MGAIHRDTEASLPEEIERVLRLHSVWIASNGRQGMRAEFVGRDLRGLNFSSCDVRGVTFEDSDLTGTAFVRSELFLTSFRRANLEGADFSLARLAGTNFSECRLGGASFVGARVEGAEILDPAGKRTGKSLPARFRNADLREANFVGAILDGGPHADHTFQGARVRAGTGSRSEELTSELQSLMRISY